MNQTHNAYGFRARFYSHAIGLEEEKIQTTSFNKARRKTFKSSGDKVPWNLCREHNLIGFGLIDLPEVNGNKSQLSPWVPTGFLMPALLQGAPARIRRRGRHSHDLIRAIANDEELSRLVVVARSMIRDGGSGWVLVLAGTLSLSIWWQKYYNCFILFKTQESFNIWQQAHLDQNEFRCPSWILFLTAQASRAYIRGHNFAFS